MREHGEQVGKDEVETGDTEKTVAVGQLQELNEVAAMGDAQMMQTGRREE